VHRTGRHTASAWHATRIVGSIGMGAAMQEQWANAIGWASTTILIVTLSRQVLTLYRTEHPEATSRWLFAGQIAASIGFIAYSALLDNMVFVVANALILLTAIVGQIVSWRKQERRAREPRRRRQRSRGRAGISGAGA
jgi:MtN3 and saliva related transmembrane protein